VLAHSDAEAWNLRPMVLVVGEHKILAPWSDDTRAPLTREATEILAGMANKPGGALHSGHRGEVRTEVTSGRADPERGPGNMLSTAYARRRPMRRAAAPEAPIDTVPVTDACSGRSSQGCLRCGEPKTRTPPRSRDSTAKAQ
jgi:hypothetical protein